MMHVKGTEGVISGNPQVDEWLIKDKSDMQFHF